jgi:outer membrane protein
MKRLILFAFCIATLTGKIISQDIPQDSVWTLENCIDYAFKQNIQVRKTEISNQTSELYAAQAKAQRFPSLSASLSQNFDWSRSNLSSDRFNGNNGSGVSVNSGVTLFNYSRLTNLIRQSELSVESGKFDLETIKESISLNILNAYLQILYAEEQVNNSRKQIESTESQLDLASERLDLKIISQADYAQVKSQLASEKLTLANSESQLAMAKVNLMQLMELPVTSEFNISHSDIDGFVNQNRKPDVGSIFETAISIKPQIKASALSKEIAGLDEDIAKAAYYPVLSASAGLNSSYSSQMSGDYFSQIDNGLRPSVGFSLSIPIYQRKQAKTSVAVAELGYSNAELDEINTRNQLRKDIEQACQDVISAQIEYEASVESYNSTIESSTLSDEKFRQGIINSVDYLVSKTNLIVAESKVLQSKYNLIFSYKVLDFYTGVPLTI